MLPDWLPLLILALSMVPGLVIFGLPEDRVRLRSTLNVGGALGKAGLVLALIPAVVAGDRAELRAPFVPGIDFVLRVDTFALYFLALSSVLWLVTTIYAIGYLEGSPHRSRFFAFFSLCVTATSGIALSGNLVTFLVFYELLTLVTYPLVIHRQTPEALAGGRSYLRYTLAGGAVLLVGVGYLTALVGPVEFADQGSPEIAALAQDRPAAATTAFVLLVAGMAVKAALVPLHGWLPKAMVAPAPVSALLHAVAVVKAGVFGIVLVVDNVFGVVVAADLGLLLPLAVVASVTIVYGSLRALQQDGLKARLAYSTVSQVSYVALGVAIPAAVATTGAVAHIVHQGLMKITLFFCAGLLAETLGLHRVSQLAGVGRRMPLSCGAFTAAALGMIGIPPMAGFVSKWYLGTGAIDAGMDWVLLVLLASSLLNAAYFLPIVYAMWWREPEGDVAWEVPYFRQRARLEAPATLLVPTLVAATLALLAGLLAGMTNSPLDLARTIVERMYGA